MVRMGMGPGNRTHAKPGCRPGAFTSSLAPHILAWALLRASWRRLGSLTVLEYGSVARPSHEALATRPNQNVNLEMNSLKKTGSVTSVEVAGFEPAIPASRTRCSNQVEPHLDGRDGGNRTHEIGLMRAVSHHESSRHPRRESNPESKLRRLASGAAGTGVILKS